MLVNSVLMCLARCRIVMGVKCHYSFLTMAKGNKRLLSVIKHVCVVLWARVGYLLCKGNGTCNNTLLRGMVRT